MPFPQFQLPDLLVGFGLRFSAEQRKPEIVIWSHGEVVSGLLDYGKAVAAEDLLGDHACVMRKIDGDRLREA